MKAVQIKSNLLCKRNAYSIYRIKKILFMSIKRLFLKDFILEIFLKKHSMYLKNWKLIILMINFNIFHKISRIFKDKTIHKDGKTWDGLG